MAARTSVLLNHSDSNVLTVVDMVSGHLSNVEMPHTEALDDIYPHPEAGKIWLDFDADGARVAAYLGDGQLGDPATDYAQAVFGEWTQAPNSAGSFNTTDAFRISKNAFMFLKVANDVYLNSGFEIRDQNDVVISSNSTQEMNRPYGIIPDGILVGQELYSGNYNIQMDWSSGGFYASGWFVRNSKISFIHHAIDEKDYVVEMTWDDANQILVFSRAFLLRDVNTSTEHPSYALGGNNNVISLENGTYIIQGGDSTYYLWDGVEGNEPTWLGYEFTFPEGAQTIAAYFSHGVDINILDNNDVLGTFAKYETARTVGLSVTNISIDDGAISIITTPPLTALPVLEDNGNWYIDTSTNSRAGTIFAGSYRDENNVDHNMATLFLLDKTNYTNPIKQVSILDYAKFLTCPLAEFNNRDVVVIQKQAYEVTGAITENGDPIETPVILLDNESGNICGRGTSDPVTGVYYFRCWTNGDKSVLAKNPIDGGWRIAAMRTPVMVG